jgi:hypothetical protein
LFSWGLDYDRPAHRFHRSRFNRWSNHTWEAVTMTISDFIDDNPNIIYSPLAESIRESMKLIIKEVSYMEDTGEEFSDAAKYNALVTILNSSSSYFRKNLHI